MEGHRRQVLPHALTHPPPCLVGPRVWRSGSGTGGRGQSWQPSRGRAWRPAGGPSWDLFSAASRPGGAATSRRRIAHEDRQEPGLDQRCLPAEAVEGLAPVDAQEVERPHGGPHQHAEPQRGPAGGRRGARTGRGRRAGPCQTGRKPVGVVQVEDAGSSPEGHRLQEARHGTKAPFADKGPELQRRAHEAISR